MDRLPSAETVRGWGSGPEMDTSGRREGRARRLDRESVAVRQAVRRDGRRVSAARAQLRMTPGRRQQQTGAASGAAGVVLARRWRATSASVRTRRMVSRTKSSEPITRPSNQCRTQRRAVRLKGGSAAAAATAASATAGGSLASSAANRANSCRRAAVRTASGSWTARRVESH